MEQRLNSVYDSGALNTYGLDTGYFITPVLKASVGYYYQHRDQEDIDGSLPILPVFTWKSWDKPAPALEPPSPPDNPLQPILKIRIHTGFLVI